MNYSIAKPLHQKYQDHKLKGEWRDFRECHIEPDWLLIYTIADFELRPVRLGIHSKLFDEGYESRVHESPNEEEVRDQKELIKRIQQSAF